ncbi:DUF3761 domain-containing protein [Streptomyces anulatus]|uniref:hypothetical protein n=1 Tax=Streptomyces anulatus TaxID=1892 RepID=UPI00386ED57A|nr:DUF3761 domain-containing protein [Streptomyces anulatus]
MTTRRSDIADRLRHIATIITVTLAALFIAAWAGFIIVMNIATSGDSKPQSATTAEPTPTGTPITWIIARETCRDGWPSTSIGKRGACSHHGGVVTIYQSTLGNLETLCPRAYQPRTLERAQVLLAEDGTVDCDFEQP